MSETEYNKSIEEYKNQVERFGKVKVGDKVYIEDCWMDIFECIVLEVNIKDGYLIVDDKSEPFNRNEKGQYIKKIHGFLTEKEANDYLNSDSYKYKIF